MAEQHLLRALPLVSGRRNPVRLELPLAEVGCRVDDDPWDGTAEVHDLRESGVEGCHACVRREQGKDR